MLVAHMQAILAKNTRSVALPHSEDEQELTHSYPQKLPEDERMKEDKLLFDLLEQNGWVRGPQCGVSIADRYDQ